MSFETAHEEYSHPCLPPPHCLQQPRPQDAACVWTNTHVPSDSSPQAHILGHWHPDVLRSLLRNMETEFLIQRWWSRPSHQENMWTLWWSNLLPWIDLLLSYTSYAVNLSRFQQSELSSDEIPSEIETRWSMFKVYTTRDKTPKWIW